MVEEFVDGPRLVEAFDAAVAQPHPHQVMAGLQRCITALALPGGITLPAQLQRPLSRHYARREIHRSARLGYSVVVMTWAPGQGAPIHDHDALWCVEGVLHGQLEVTDYALLEQRGPRFRFSRGQPGIQQVGSTHALRAPAEFHAVRNPDPDRVAVSLHVYQSPLQRFGVYEPEHIHSPWHLRRQHRVGTD